MKNDWHYIMYIKNTPSKNCKLHYCHPNLWREENWLQISSDIGEIGRMSKISGEKVYVHVIIKLHYRVL